MVKPNLIEPTPFFHLLCSLLLMLILCTTLTPLTYITWLQLIKLLENDTPKKLILYIYIYIIQYTKRTQYPCYCLPRLALATESCKGSRVRVGLSFCRDAFGIEKMVGEKMISSSFGGATGPGYGHLALGLACPGHEPGSRPQVGTPGVWVALHVHWVRPARPRGTEAGLPWALS